MSDEFKGIVGLDGVARPRNRREFLRAVGLGGAVITIPVLMSACDDDTPTGGNGGGDTVTLDLRTNVGILNYAFALEQLEAAFYTAVVANFPSDLADAGERQILTDIRDHEVVHREFFRAAIPAANRIPDITPVLAATQIDTRAKVLGLAKTFEDLGVAAYGGAAKYLSTDATGLGFLLVAGKIVSVEARHAAVIRDLINPKSADFAGDDIINAQGLERVLEPSAVLAAADPFIQETIETQGP